MKFQIRSVYFGATLFFLPFFVLHGFNFPSSDDFTYSTMTIENGFLQSQIDVYTDWHGRFVPIVLMSFNPLIWHQLDLYKVCSLLNMLFLLFSFYSLIKTITDILDIEKYRWSGFIVFSIMVFAHWPGLSEGFYWMSGYTTYTIPISVLLFGLSWYLKWEFKNSFSPLKILLLSLTSVIVVGSSESLMLQLCLYWFLATVFVSFKSKERFSRHLIFFITSCLGALVVVAAPGNLVRKTHFPSVNPFYAFIKSIFSALEHTTKFISPPLIFFLLLVGLVIYKNREHKSLKWLGSLKSKNLWLTYFSIMTIGYFPPQVSMGGNPSARFDNMYYVFFLIFMSLICATWVYQNRKKFTTLLNYCPFLIKFQNLITLFIFSSLFWDNTILAYRDMIWRGPVYISSMNDRVRIAKTHPGEDLVFDHLKIPTTVIFNSISSDLEASNNKHFSKYFNISSIREEEPHSKPKD